MVVGHLMRAFCLFPGPDEPDTCCKGTAPQACIFAQLACVCRRTGAIDVDEAMVLDMGQYEMPHAAAADKKTTAAAGPPNLAGW